jgi:hypothetical protein
MRGLLQLLIMGGVAVYQRNSFIGPTWMFRFILFLVRSLCVISCYWQFIGTPDGIGLYRHVNL